MTEETLNDQFDEQLREMQRRVRDDDAARAAQSRPDFCRTRLTVELHTFSAIVQEAGLIGIVVGPPGAGKTRALETYESDLGAVYRIEALPHAPDQDALLEQLCSAVDVVAVKSKSRATRHELVSSRMRKGLGPNDRDWFLGRRANSLLIIDEAQRLDDNALELVRSLHDHIGGGTILCANHRLESRLFPKTNKKNPHPFPQLEARIDRVYHCDAQVHRDDFNALCDHYRIASNEARELVWSKVRTPRQLHAFRSILNVASIIAPRGTVISADTIRNVFQQLSWDI